MNNDTRHKILSHEVTPPAGTWDKIASALDGSDSGMAFPRRLHDMEVPAPAHTWQHIAAALDSTTAGRRLYEMEVPAPARAWQNIAAALDEAGEAVTPAKTFRIPWLKYAAAAAIISFLTWGALAYFKQQKDISSDMAVAPVPVKTTPVPEQIDPAKADNSVAVTDQQRDDAALENSKHTFASIDVSSIRRKVQRSSFQFADPVELASFPGTVNPAGTYQELACNEVNQPAVSVPNDTNLSTRYVLLMTPDGKIIRISRKWSSLLCCVSGEDSDPGCKDQVKQWREKIASSAASPSSGNFMDILSLVNALQEK